MPRIPQLSPAKTAELDAYQDCELSSKSTDRVEALVTELIGRVADKWTMLVIEVLTEKGELRFTRLRDSVPGVSYKMRLCCINQVWGRPH